MSTSIPVLNRNNTLPPLLLPDLRSLGKSHQDLVVNIHGDEFFATKRNRKPEDSDENTLDGLATIALKRPKLDTSMPKLDTSMPVNLLPINVNRLTLITPPPTAPASAPSTAPATAPVSATISPSPSYLEVNDPQEQSLKMEKKTSSAPPISNSLNSKRQRIGPSCDGCRLKKIKCDAKIEILLQDESIIPLVSNSLHHIFTHEEIIQNLDTLFQNVQLPSSVLQKNPPDKSIVIKHIDKIIHFRPCSSCCKRNTGSKNCCEFSKGFTRADINVFSKIKTRLKKESIYEMEIFDYKNAGF